MTKKATIACAMVMVATFASAKDHDRRLGTTENPVVWSYVPSDASSAAGAEFVARLLYETTRTFFRIELAAEHNQIIEALSSKPPRAHMASLEAVPYIVAADRGVAEVALVSVRFGSAFYRGQIVTSSKSGVKEIGDLAGKTFARPDPESNSGWFFPMLKMLAAGVNPERDLMGIVDAGSHDSVVEWVHYGDVDAGASYVGANSQLRVDVICISSDIPHIGVHFHPSVHDEMRREIACALLEIAGTRTGRKTLSTAFQWSNLERHDDSIYDPFRQLIEDSGIDIKDLLE